MFSRDAYSNTTAYLGARQLLNLLIAAFLLFFVLGGGRVFGAKVGKEAGSPTGSYPLSGFDSVSLFSGNLNFNLPLLPVGGRGAAGTQLILNIQRNWSYWRYMREVSISYEANGNGSFRLPESSDSQCQGYLEWATPNQRGYDDAMFFHKLFCSNNGSPATAYTFITSWYSPIPESTMNPIKPGYGPGILKGKTRIFSTQGCRFFDPTVNAYRYDNYQMRPWVTQAVLMFTDPDGTEHEFIDKKTLGGSYTFTSSMCDTPNPTPRETVWLSKEDTGTVFVADAPLPEIMSTTSSFAVEQFYGPSGVMIKKDGTRYRIDAGLVSWMRDRNGNVTSFHYDGNKRVDAITDSLGRHVTIDYDIDDQTTSPDGTPFGLCDRINYEGVNGAPRTIRITKTTLPSALAEGYAMRTTAQLWPHMGTYGNAGAPLAVPVVSALWLPDNRAYKFSYNSFAELARVELPTGGAVEYTHDYTLNLDNNGQWVEHTIGEYPLLRRVSEKREYTDKNDRSSLILKTTFGDIYANSVHGFLPTAQPVVVDQRDKNDKLLSRTKHSFIGHPLNISGDLVRLPPWDNGLEKQVDLIDPEDPHGTKVLKRVEYTWEPRVPAQGNADALDVRLLETKTTLNLPDSTSLVTKQRLAYNDFNNVTDRWDYDFGVGSPTTYPMRHVHTDYLTTNNNLDYTDTSGPHILGLPRAQQIYSVDAQTGSETLAAQSETRYDETALLPWYGATAVIGWADPGSARGNPTTARNWLNTTGAWIESHAQFDQCGNISKTFKTVSGQEIVSEAVFDDDFGTPNDNARDHVAPSELGGKQTYAFATQVKNALGHTAYTQFDYYTGQVVNAEDANGTVSSMTYGDPLDRPTRAESAVNIPSLHSQVTYVYDDANRRIAVTSDLNSLDDNLLKSESLYDGLGRTTEVRQYETTTQYVATLTNYDALGRAFKSSNPYRPTMQETPVWTTNAYDALGRVASTTTPDGATVYSHYDGARTLVTDQAGKQRISKADALGRLTEVWEVRSSDTSTGTEAVSFPHYADVPAVSAGYKTSYTYDVLGNLLKVEQKLGQSAQRRYFAYDSLGRLMRAKNTEQDALGDLQLPASLLSPLSDGNNDWSLAYEYDEAGELKKKTDARGKSVDYTYDKLGRITLRDYSDDTPDVTYAYDAAGVANAKGMLTSVSSSVSVYNYTAYDASGRVKSSSQTTGGVTYSMPEYKYDLAGNLTSEKYPSGKVFETKYDAAGRVAGVARQGGDYYAGGDPGVANNANVISYAAHGGVAALRLGNGLWEHALYNERLQPYEIGLGASPTDSSKLKLEYAYAPTLDPTADPIGGTKDRTKNDGDVRSQRISVPAEGATPAQTFTQTYAYDALNRLESASEVKGAAETWRQTYSYDRFGNRRLDEPHTTRLNASGATVYAVDSSNRPAVNPAVSASTNRVSEAGYSFDASGDLLCDPLHPCAAAPAPAAYFDYDAENRMVRAGGGAQAGGSEYAYDGNGKRVKKTSGAVVTVYVYDAAGALVAEYGGAQPQAGGVSYVTRDTLGSTRAVSRQDGGVVSRHDYLPFGEEVDGVKLPNTGREGFASYNYGGTRQKFTGYERDAETNLDYAQARYFSPVQARFTSVDPLLDSARSANPQTWNRYAYVSNNPLASTDPTGMFEWRMDDKTRKVDWYKEGDDRTGTTEIQPDENGVLRYPYIGNPEDIDVILNPEGPRPLVRGGRANMLLGTTFFFQRLHGFGTVDEEARGWKLGLSKAANARFMASGVCYERPEDILLAVSVVHGGFTLASGLRSGSALAEGAASPASRALTRFYPPEDGFAGATESKFLMPGEMIDRFGGTPYSRFFSPVGTPAAARSLPPSTLSQPLRTFEVLKPFEVNTGRVAPWFGQPGGGTQVVTPVRLEVLLQRGFLQEVGP